MVKFFGHHLVTKLVLCDHEKHFFTQYFLYSRTFHCVSQVVHVNQHAKMTLLGQKTASKFDPHVLALRSQVSYKDGRYFDNPEGSFLTLIRG